MADASVVSIAGVPIWTGEADKGLVSASGEVVGVVFVAQYRDNSNYHAAAGAYTPEHDRPPDYGGARNCAGRDVTGRPSGYTEEIADEICERLANGESLRAICAGEGKPSQSMVFRWLQANEGFRERYARAREAQADVLADESIDIADDATNDWMEINAADERGEKYRLNGEHVQRSRLRIDTRKWFASKLAPKKYGEKLAVGGDDDAPPIRVEQVVRRIVRPDAGNPDR